VAGCGTHVDVGGTGIDVTLATGSPGACECRSLGGAGTLADVEWDLLFANDEQSSPGGDFIITFSNLMPGASYRLLSYHSRTDEGDTTIPGVTITGATVVSAPASIVQTHTIMDNPAECIFIPGAGDVSIRYLAPAGGCGGCQAFFNGFVLELAAPTITFESDASGGMETVSPALVPVNLINPEPGETYTVQYNANGGTATPGEDYSLIPDTLVFYPGEFTHYITIDINDDDEAEEDETIMLELSNGTGLDVVIGLDQHAYTISDTQPTVSFRSPTSSGPEGTTPALVAVDLSHASDQTITVNYGVTGGTAANGTDYTLGGSVLQFDPLETTLDISINIAGDAESEPDETIILSLSEPRNASLGAITGHTHTITDDEEGVVWDDKIWYYSDNTANFFVNAQDQLVWLPEKGGQYVTRIAPEPLSSVGDKVEVSYWYMSDGKDDCPPDSCYNCIYCDDDITCIAGTADFRFGLFQTDGEYVTADGFDTSSSIFEGYKGYNWRFGPHLQPYPIRWAQCGTGEIHKTGNFNKKPQSSSNLMTINEGEIRDEHDDIQYIPGFDLPPGEWSMIIISLERLSSSNVELSITLNDTTYTCMDTSGSEQPTLIDVFGVHMRNGRPYSILALERVGPPPPLVYPADNPNPMDGAQDVAEDALLSWRAGEGATQHDVYLGTDLALVGEADTTSAAHRITLNVDVNSYDPGGLEMGTTYYWRIDESGGSGTCAGSVWHFTVGNYTLVDDMESYNEVDVMSDTWKDYPYPDANNYSFVYLEQSTVHGGQKSMEFSYDAWLGTYFTATRIFLNPRNWSLPDLNHLSLWFHGHYENLADDRMYIVLDDDGGHMGKVMYDGDPNDIKQEQWLEWNIPLQDFADQGVDLSKIEELIIGVDCQYWLGTIYFDDVRLRGTRCIAEYAPTADVTGNCAVDWEDFGVLASQWLGPPATPSADIAPNPPDGAVNGLDLAALAGQWLEMGLFPP
jgi:hypothetical protein